MMAHPEAPRDSILSTWQWMSLFVIVIGGTFGGITYVRTVSQEEQDTMRREIKIVTEDLEKAADAATRYREILFTRITELESDLSGLKARVTVLHRQVRPSAKEQRK